MLKKIRNLFASKQITFPAPIVPITPKFNRFEITADILLNKLLAKTWKPSQVAPSILVELDERANKINDLIEDSLSGR